jgi:biotin carboxylase
VAQRHRVAVLHHARSFFPLDLYQAIRERIDVLWVLPGPADADATTRRLLRRLGTVVDLAGLDLDAAAQALADHRPEGIVTFVDDHVVLAAELAARLDLPYHSPDGAAVLVDKRRQRAALDRAGIAGPRNWAVAVGLTADDARRLADEVCYPAVLKQAEGSGSRDMYAVRTADELLPLLMDGGPALAGGLIEEYLRDDTEHDPRFASYLSVESVVGPEGVVHAAVTGRFPLAPPFRETGNFIPAIVPPGRDDEILAMVDQAIAALQIAVAVIHTEIKLTPAGPALIEVNGRLGGRPPFVLQSVSDTNLFLAACLLAAGAPPGVDAPAVCSGVGYWRMLQAPMWARRVTAVDGLAGLSAHPGVETIKLNRRAGDPVDWREGTDGNVVVVRGRVDDHAALAEIIRLIDDTVRIDYAS